MANAVRGLVCVCIFHCDSRNVRKVREVFCFRCLEIRSFGGLEVFLLISRSPNLPEAKAILTTIALSWGRTESSSGSSEWSEFHPISPFGRSLSVAPPNPPCKHGDRLSCETELHQDSEGYA